MPTYSGPDGVALHHEVRGADRPTDPPVVVLAGGAGRHPDYLGDLAGLTELADLVVPHLRGVGESAAPVAPERGSYWRQAGDLEALRAHLGAERLVLVAHSAGTRLAVSYAAQYAERLAAMILVCPPTGYLVDEPADAAAVAAVRAGEPAFDDAWATLNAGPDVRDDAAFTAWQRRTAPASYAVWDATARAHALVGRWRVDAAQAWFATPPPADLAARLWDVGAPVLVVGGAQDCLTGVAPVIALADLFPDRGVVTVPGCGHYPWVEAPALFRAAVDPFLLASTVRASDSGRAALLRNRPSG